MEDFFAKATADAASLPEHEGKVVAERLERAKGMFGGIDPLAALSSVEGARREVRTCYEVRLR
jgi:hypothetical protein